MGCVGGRGEWATFANCIGRSLPPNFEKIFLILYNLVLNVALMESVISSGIV